MSVSSALRASAAVAVVLTGCIGTSAPSSSPAAPSSAVAGCPAGSLRALAAARSFGFGIGATNDRSLYAVRDTRAADTLRCHATALTNNAFYWSIVEPKRGTFNFTPADEIVAFARAAGMTKMRGHTLVWQQVLPAWLEQGSFGAEELKAVLKEHVQTIVRRYRGVISAWDVVNEAFDDKGELRRTLWTRTIGPEFLELAFRWAHEADPDALLFYNDNRNEGSGPVSDAIYEFVRDLRAKGVPIHGVGMQMHLLYGRETAWVTQRAGTLGSFAANLKRLGELGVQVHLTEMDVSLVGLPGPDPLAHQAAIYGDVLRTCLAAPSCTALLTWGLDDGHTWVTGRFKDSERAAPLLLDADLRPKPAYEEVRKALGAAR